MNKMMEIRVEKVTLNIGLGEPGEKLNMMKELLERISNEKAVKTKSNKRIPTWNIRPKLEIGVKSVIRGKKAVELLKNLLKAKGDVLKDSNFDDTGNLNFGVEEYIDIPNIKYDPKIGMRGLNVCVTLERPGYRVKRRRIRPARIGKKHAIKKEEAIAFMKKNFGVALE
jgi:large subunit ribosomal protein L5